MGEGLQRVAGEADAGRSLRLILVAGVGILAAGVFFLVFSALAAGQLFGWANGLFPAVSGETPNISTSRNVAQAFAPLSLSIVAGIIAGTIVARPAMSERRELALALAAFLPVVAFSSVNFWVLDQLIHVRAQALLDAILVASSLIVLAFIWRWQPARVTARVLKALIAFVVSLFGVFLPGFFLLALMLISMGVSGWATLGLNDTVQVVSAVASLLAAVAAFWPQAKADAEPAPRVGSTRKRKR